MLGGRRVHQGMPRGPVSGSPRRRQGSGATKDRTTIPRCTGIFGVVRRHPKRLRIILIITCVFVGSCGNAQETSRGLVSGRSRQRLGDGIERVVWLLLCITQIAPMFLRSVDQVLPAAQGEWVAIAKAAKVGHLECGQLDCGY